jgi:hypothetical protein
MVANQEQAINLLELQALHMDLLVVLITQM